MESWKIFKTKYQSIENIKLVKNKNQIDKNINEKDYKKLHNFFWLFTIDLKSSKQNIHFIISNWIKYNSKYNSKSWSFDITAKSRAGARGLMQLMPRTARITSRKINHKWEI